jgi:ATP-dependent Lon protease
VIEAAFMPGRGQLILTGQIGDVMQESCKAALTYCRSNAEKLGIDTDLFKSRDIHLHFPAGAIPKDGPSAGITIAVAIISLFANKPVSAKVAMTGEISLKGRVLPVGGLKEKLLGAKRNGIFKILVPAANRKDIDDIPEDIREGLDVIYVSLLDEVLPHVFNLRPQRAPQESKAEAPQPASQTKAPAQRPVIRKAPPAKIAPPKRAAKSTGAGSNGVRPKH